MKKLSISLFVLGIIGLGLIFVNKNEISMVEGVKHPNHSESKVLSLISPDSAVASVTKIVAAVEAPSVEDLEKKFSSFSDKELEEQIAINNQMAKDLNLFNLANSGNLDSSLTKVMVQYIRVNRVLNQILLSKQIDYLEREVL